MNGYYAEKEAAEALVLATANAAELKETRETLRLLVVFLTKELGPRKVKTLLNQLENKK